jgi:aspartyl-tRNA(Asn)/glutamyl-tRNA(Gln) amidotransferase subunit B
MKIGLEVHVQLPTKSKLFCSCSTSAEEPNSSICPTCLGFPGSRPALNRRALEMGVEIARFLDCKIPEEVWFSRKTYFYPDLPKNFQITQYDSALGTDGCFIVKDKTIGIWRAHLEEDPGRIKRVGKSGEEVSLIDYNRSGIPLVEIVTAPDLSSPEEARIFLQELLVELRHIIGTTAGDEQSVRVDANISMEGGERVEVKNIQGLRNLEKALKFEASRQFKMLEAGMKVIRETRRYDEERKVTMPSREKETEEDYGYIGEPDLGTFSVGVLARSISTAETPLRRAQRMAGHYALEFSKMRQIVLTSMQLADVFEMLAQKVEPEIALAWTLGPISANWSALLSRMDDQVRTDLISIIIQVTNREITDSEARRRIGAIASGECPADLSCAVEDRMLDTIISSYIDEHPQVVKDYSANPKSANSVIGHVMKVARGKYNSQEVVEAVRKEIEKRK